MKFQSVNSAGRSNSSGSGSNMVSKKLSCEPPTVISSDESRYMTSLWVFGNEDSQSTIIDIEPRPENSDQHQQKLQEMIKAALKLLTFRERHVLVQFWSSHVVGKQQLLATFNQPYGLGVLDQGLCSYRRVCESNSFVVDKDHDEEEDRSPPARVFRRLVPEWTFDLTNYLPEDFPHQDVAIKCNLHGYLALPVFYLTTGLCAGVLELLTVSKYRSYAYEVQQVHSALKTVNLTTLQAFDYPSSDVPNDRMQNDLDKILRVLKAVSDTHNLPLAQTWAISPLGSFVSHEKMLEKSCSSFNSRCVGKVCMYTNTLPYHVGDVHTWDFREVCKVSHLEKSQGVAGRALLSRGSCFCRDVTKLSEEEYPLVHYAHMNGLTSCFAIFLHSVEGNDDYVLEFFFPFEMEDGTSVPNLVKTLKQQIKAASGFELGDGSSIQVVGAPREVISLSLNVEPHTIKTSSATTTNTNMFKMVSSDSESMVANVTTTESANVENQWSSKQNYLNKSSGTKVLVGDNVIRDGINVVSASENDNTTFFTNVSMQKMSNDIIDALKKSSRSKKGRKRKIDFLTMEAVVKHVGKPIDLAAKNLDVSRTTLKRFCREHGMPSWPYLKQNKGATKVTDLKLLTSSSKQKLQRSSNFHFSLSFIAFLVVRVKRWKNKCLIRNAMQNRDQSDSSDSTENLRYKANINDNFSLSDWQIFECNRVHESPPLNVANFFIEGSNPFSKPAKARFGIYEAAFLVIALKRWRRRSALMHTTQYNHSLIDSLFDDQFINPYIFHKLPKKNVGYFGDTEMVTVKAAFKDDIIKFQIPTSSSLLELENQVAQRIKLNSRKFRLKYCDEDNDMILLACDADLHNLLRFSDSYSHIRLFIMMASD